MIDYKSSSHYIIALTQVVFNIHVYVEKSCVIAVMVA